MIEARPVALRSFRLALAVAGGLLSGAGCVATSGGTDDQDACRIGAVAAKEYETIAVEIAALPPIDWDKALEAERPADGVAAALRERLEQVLAGRTGADEQVAAMPCGTLRPSPALVVPVDPLLTRRGIQRHWRTRLLLRRLLPARPARIPHFRHQSDHARERHCVGGRASLEDNDDLSPARKEPPQPDSVHVQTILVEHAYYTIP